MIEEVETLIMQLGIDKKEAEEIINIYFECYGDHLIYDDFLNEEIRIVPKTNENSKIVKKLQNETDMNMFISDDYVIITNYSSEIRRNRCEDLLPNNSF